MKLSPGFPKFTNEVQHLLDKVLQWDDTMHSSPWKTGVRLPGLATPGKQSAKSQQLWIARHRPFCGS
ncbi:protein of unknown function [Nitrospira japonica]|uniref:Uncharacterized protein n=1 Tax=Nitrospira japonica TaxID=1325564 RepID=A0A1W1HZR0_9BACT|nr:protein of unknown function [Nitrospira japonica]